MVAACGPFCVFGPWQARQTLLPGLRSIASLSVPCGSWQLKQVTPRAYIRLGTKSLPCMRFLCAVPSGEMGEASSRPACAPPASRSR